MQQPTGGSRKADLRLGAAALLHEPELLFEVPKRYSPSRTPGDGHAMSVKQGRAARVVLIDFSEELGGAS